MGVIILVLWSMLFLSNCNLSDNKEPKKTDSSNTAEVEDRDFTKEGMDIALSTKAVLGKNLISAIQSRGTEKALEFCNAKAIVLTDSLGVKLNARIKRVSDKYRNPANAANEDELSYIKQAKQAIKENIDTWAELQEHEDYMIGYYPIMTNAMCLQCHGKPNVDINNETLAMISNKYPNDRAIDYLPNELRGIWVVEMDK